MSLSESVENRNRMLTLRRIRGYQFKSEGKATPRKNPIAYRSLNDRKEKFAESSLPSLNADAVDLEKVGFPDIFDEGA